MTIVNDAPLMVAESPVKDLETKAIAMYRAAHPDGTPWQELSDGTRHLWVIEAAKPGEKG